MTLLDRPTPITGGTTPLEPLAAEPPRRTGRTRATYRLLRRQPQRLSLAVGLLVVAVMHLVNLGGWPIFFDDEGTYVAEAWATYKGQLAQYSYWYDHPPVGWLQLAALMGVPDLVGISPSVVVARYVMVGYTLVTALLIYRLCRNLGMRHLTSLVGMLAWGLSPLVLFEGRQVLLDNIALPWLLGAFVLSTAQKRLLWQHIGSGLCFGIAILTKETTLLLAPALLFAMWSHAYRPTRLFSVIGAATMTALVGGIYPLFALLKHELVSGTGHVSLQDGIVFQLFGRVGSGNLWDSTSIARSVLDRWLVWDHVLPIGGVLAAVACLFVPRLRAVGVALVLMVAIALRPGGYLPLMYIVAVLPFAAAALAGVGEVAVTWLWRRRSHGVPVGAITVAAVLVVLDGWLAPTWAQRTSTALTSKANAPYYAALAYMEDNLPRSSRILADDAYWNPLVNAGWSSDGWEGPIWYFKLDLDPVARDGHFSGGWRAVDYLVVNDVMVDNLDGQTKLPQLDAAYLHSTVVRTWGTGIERVQLRKITRT